jgi:hypothetical protein
MITANAAHCHLFPKMFVAPRLTGLACTWELKLACLHIKTERQPLPLAPYETEDVMQRRRRSVPHAFEEILATEKAKLEAQVAKLKPGPQMDELLMKVRQLETALHINEWLSSPELQPQGPA